MANASDSGTFRAGQKRRFVPTETVDQRDAVEPVAWRKVRLPSLRGKFIPGAHQLAIVTAVDAIAHGGAQCFRDDTIEFDG